MVKNIILDIGGILFDDSKENTEKLLGKNCDYIYKITYGKTFQKCLLREISVQDYINGFKDNKEFTIIKYILEKDNLSKSYPLMKNNFEYIKSLKKKGYRLFLLTNITEDVTVTATYTILNNSEDLSAKLSATTTNDNETYFTVTQKIADPTTITAGNTTTIEVTVELIKTPVTADETATIGVEITAEPQQP